MADYDVTLVARTPVPAPDAPVLTEVDRLKLNGLSWSDALTRAGEIHCSLDVDTLNAEAKLRLTNLVAYPCELWVHRDGIRVAAGPVTARQIQGRSVTVTAAGLAYYLQYMRRVYDYITSSRDQYQIVKDLIDWEQATVFPFWDYAHFGLDTDGIGTSGVTRELTIEGSELRSLDEIIRQMGGRDNGFDIWVDPTTRAVMLATPRRQRDLTGTVILDGRYLRSAQVAHSVAAGKVASEVWASSSSSSGTSALSTAADNPAVAASFGRVLAAQAFHDITNASTLLAHARRAADDMATPAITISPNIVTGVELDPTTLQPGDLITYDYDAGLGQETHTLRVDTITTKVDVGNEDLTLAFV